MTRTTPFRLMTLHFSQIFLTLGRTFMTAPLGGFDCAGGLELLDDLSAVRVETREFHPDAIADDESDDLVAE